MEETHALFETRRLKMLALREKGVDPYGQRFDVTGTIALPEGTEMVMPGDNTDMTVELGKPIAMVEGLRFAIREGGRTVASGRVTKILE